MAEKWLDGKSPLFQQRRQRREQDVAAMRASRKRIRAAEAELSWEAKNGNWVAALIAPENGFATRSMEVDVHVNPPATRSMIHKHNEAVLFVLRGNGYVTIEDEEIQFSPGDTIFIPHGLWHQITNPDPDEPVVMLGIKNHMLMEHLGELNIDYKPDEPTINPHYAPGQTFVDVMPLFRATEYS